MARNSQLGKFLKKLLENPMDAVGSTAPRIIAKRNPEVGTLVEVIAGLVGTRTASRTQYNQRDAEAFLNTLKRQGWGVFPIIGLQNSGKSIFALWLARFVDNPHNYAIGMQTYQVPSDFKVLSSILEVERLPANSTVILDDIAQFASIYTYYKRDEAQAIINFVTLCRQKKLFIIATGQNTRSINSHLFDTLETIFFKVPPISAQLERPAVREVFPTLQQFFYGKPEKWQQQHVFCWSARYIGGIQYDASSII